MKEAGSPVWLKEKLATGRLLDAEELGVGPDEELTVRYGDGGTSLVVVGLPHLGEVQDIAGTWIHDHDFAIVIHDVYLAIGGSGRLCRHGGILLARGPPPP